MPGVVIAGPAAPLPPIRRRFWLHKMDGDWPGVSAPGLLFATEAEVAKLVDAT